MIEAKYTLDYDVLSITRHHTLYLLACIKAHADPQAAERSPLNLSVVLDRSGSMEGSKLAYVKEAAQFLVCQLGVQDCFSLVTYDSTVAVPVAPTRVVHKDQINQTIQAIHAGGQTNLSGGWLQGCELVDEGIGYRPEPRSLKPRTRWLPNRREQSLAQAQVNRVLLLTDGLANRGVTDPHRLALIARQKHEEGVHTTTIGVGTQFNEDLLVHMASEGGGNFYFIDNPD